MAPQSRSALENEALFIGIASIQGYPPI
jgi:hypothetical protein